MGQGPAGFGAEPRPTRSPKISYRKADGSIVQIEEKNSMPGGPEAPGMERAAQTEDAHQAKAAGKELAGTHAEEKAADTQQPAGAGPKTPRGNKWKRQGLATLMSVVFIGIVVALNIVVSALSERFPSMDIDLTAQKLNSLSDQALEIAKGVEEDTEVFLVGTEEGYRKNLLYANYGIQYSQVANLADRLQEANPKIQVQFLDPDTNPEFMSQYAGDSLANGMVLVRTDKRYKILSASDMFDLQQSQMTGATETYTKVDSALAGALETVNLDKVPVLTICTGHSELLSSQNMGQFTALMEGQNFSIQQVDILTEDVPADTQVLMLPTPTTDYTDEEIQKLRAFLDDTSREEPVTLLATFYPSQGQLPKLTGFLEEWGIGVLPGVVAETDTSRMAAANASYILVDPAGSTLSENSYNRLLAPSSSPLSLLFESNGGITTSSLWATGSGAYVLTEDATQEEAENPETAQQVVAAMATKALEADGKSIQRHVVVFGSSFVFTDSFLETTAFGNRDYIADLLQLTTGTDSSAVTVATQSVQTNVLDVAASRSTILILGLGVFTIGLPLLILAAGLVIFLKRRSL